MKITPTFILLLTGVLLIVSCSTRDPYQSDLFSNIVMIDSIEGKAEYLQSPFVTAGDRLYMVGYQDGSFPDLGWHIDGEMGGIWDHPIKLMDGFSARIAIQGTDRFFSLEKADHFINYPYANKHSYQWAGENISIERAQVIPDSIEGMIVQYKVINESETKKDITFSFVGKTDLRPTWLGERTNMVDSEDQVVFDNTLSAAIGKDENNPWYVAFGSSLTAEGLSPDTVDSALIRTRGNGKNACLRFSLSIDGGQSITIPMYIAGSYKSEGELRSNFMLLKSKADELLRSKATRYRLITNTAKLTIPDSGVQQMYEWLKYNTQWLVRAVPEHGTGLSAGLPDYPWWFGCDNTYALQGVLATGDHSLVKNTILLLNKISKQTNANGRIIHEVSTNGSVYNAGNVNETAQFITLVWNYYSWTGDKALITQVYPDLQKGINWLQKEKDPDHNGYPNGSGMM
ncbi:MAG: glycogen debranching protein, partial [Chryseosolibacter sp.]